MTKLTLTRRQALQGLGGLALSAHPVTHAWAASGSPALNFLAVGDWGREGDFHQRDVADRMGETAKLLDARFVISVGDNFYEDGVTGIDDPAWQKSFEAVYNAPSLQIPWQVALGNHDYHGNSQAQLDYSGRSKRWRLPARWYSFEEQAPDDARVAFYVIDTSPMISDYYADGAVKVKVGDQKQHVDTQLAWLDSALAASKADWNIVVGHHPVYSAFAQKGIVAPMNAASPPGFADLIARLDPILHRRDVHLYLNGHDHKLQHIVQGSTHYVCTGAGSKMAPKCDDVGDFCMLVSGFVACSVNRDHLHVAYRDYTGAELHVVEIPRSS